MIASVQFCLFFYKSSHLIFRIGWYSVQWYLCIYSAVNDTEWIFSTWHCQWEACVSLKCIMTNLCSSIFGEWVCDSAHQVFAWRKIIYPRRLFFEGKSFKCVVTFAHLLLFELTRCRSASCFVIIFPPVVCVAFRTWFLVCYCMAWLSTRPYNKYLMSKSFFLQTQAGHRHSIVVVLWSCL